MGGTIFLAVLGVAALYFVMLYNGLVTLKHNAAKAWSNIDVLLRQRHEELPKLVETCRQFMQFEQETLERVMHARSQVASAREQGNIAALGPAETALHGGLMNLFAVAEAYPDLKSSEQFRHLQTRITGLENSIADRREFYNDSVNILNVRIEQFPDLLIARLFHFKPASLLEFTGAEKADVALESLFKR